MKQKFAKFMYGRYGTDELSRFLTYIGLILLVVAVFLEQTPKTIVFYLAIIVVIITYFRTFSKDLAKRRSENVKFLNQKRSISDRFKFRRERWDQRKEYKFFRCPSCKAVLRVPKGKGKIRVVCKKCGTAFEKKS